MMEIVIGLAAVPRGEALRLAEAVPELSVLVVGKPSDGGEANDAPNRVRGEANRTPDVRKKDLQEKEGKNNVVPLRNRPGNRQQPEPYFDRALR